MPKSGYKFFTLLLGAVLVAGQFLLFQVLLSRGFLPDPMAIHWGFSGQPDGFSDANTHLFSITATYLVLLGLLAYVGFGLKRRLLQPLLFGTLSFVAGFMYLLFSVTTLLQVGATAESAALAPWFIFALLAIPVAMVVIVLGKPNVVLGERLLVQIRGLTFLALDFEEVLGVEPISLRARDFGGLGIRYGKRTLAFIPSPGPGVLIKTNFGESVAIRSKNPELLEAAIAARIGK